METTGLSLWNHTPDRTGSCKQPSDSTALLREDCFVIGCVTTFSKLDHQRQEERSYQDHSSRAQRLKNPKTHAHLSVFGMVAPIINFLTATPMTNKPSDLEGLLALAWKEEWARGEDEGYDPPLHDYIDSQTALVGKVLDSSDLRAHAWALNPAAFRRHGAPSKSTGQMDPLVANSLVPTILSIIQLRRTIASVIEDVDGIDVRIGDNLPHSVWHSLELGTVTGPLGHKPYADIHRKCAPKLRLETDLTDQEHVTALRDHRRLSHAVLHPRLDAFKNPSSADQKAISQ